MILKRVICTIKINYKVNESSEVWNTDYFPIIPKYLIKDLVTLYLSGVNRGHQLICDKNSLKRSISHNFNKVNSMPPGKTFISNLENLNERETDSFYVKGIK